MFSLFFPQGFLSFIDVDICSLKKAFSLFSAHFRGSTGLLSGYKILALSEDEERRSLLFKLEQKWQYFAIFQTKGKHISLTRIQKDMLNSHMVG